MTTVAAEAALGARQRARARTTEPAVAISVPMQLVRGSLLVAAALALGLILELLLVSPLQQRAAQQSAFDEFRSAAARGVAPLYPSETTVGSPVAYLEVPAIGMRQVVVEGTSAATLFTGPGHRRDTVFPGQVGTSVVMGRRAAFGGPFARIGSLQRGSKIHVTSGQGAFDYRVVDVRHSGDKAPAAPRAGTSRVVLITAGGTSFMPSGELVIVDADSTVPGVDAGRVSFKSSALPDAEKIGAIDMSTVWRLVLWLQVLLVAAIASVWAWNRWDPRKAWIVFLPTLLLVGLLTAGEAARLLPNLL